MSNFKDIERCLNIMKRESMERANVLDMKLVSALAGCWSSLSLIRIIHNVSFLLHGCCGEWECRARKPMNNTSWVNIITPTDQLTVLSWSAVVLLLFGDVFVFVFSLCCFLNFPFVYGLLS